MPNLRVLAFSDVYRWSDYVGVFEFHRPDVVVLAGDLISDGNSAIRTYVLEAIPGFQMAKAALARRFGIQLDTGFAYSGSAAHVSGYLRELAALEHQFGSDDAFETTRQQLHTEAFYNFLTVAGQSAAVLVVRGDHDDDFEGEYDVARINRISGCQEISGFTVDVRGVRFLGLGYADTHYAKRYRSIIEQHVGPCDVVIAHNEWSRIPRLAEFRTQLIIRGHSGSGLCKVCGVPAVFTAGEPHAIAELGETVSLAMYSGLSPDGERGAIQEIFVDASEGESERYPWLSAYKSA